MDKLQVLRSIDKYDRVGDCGLFDLLTKGKMDSSGAFIDGANLSSSKALFLVSLVSKNRNLHARLNLIEALENEVIRQGEDNCGWTAWDELLNMPINEDETWKDGGRPANIAWALDDIIEVSEKVNE